MNRIVREIYQMSNGFKESIEMTQGTDGIPIAFLLRDYELPKDATALVYVQKPSRNQVLEAAEVNVERNEIVINTTKQMTAEPGESSIQVQIIDGEKNVFTFSYPLIVSASNAPINSTTGSNLLDKYIEDMKQATADAVDATNTIETKAENGEFTATIEVGETITGPAESVAAVENLGDKQNAILQFAIPRGKQGESGVMVPTAGMFTLSVDSETGNMYCDYVGDTAPVFELEENGDLYYTIPEA